MRLSQPARALTASPKRVPSRRYLLCSRLVSARPFIVLVVSLQVLCDVVDELQWLRAVYHSEHQVPFSTGKILATALRCSFNSRIFAMSLRCEQQGYRCVSKVQMRLEACGGLGFYGNSIQTGLSADPESYTKRCNGKQCERSNSRFKTSKMTNLFL